MTVWQKAADAAAALLARPRKIGPPPAPNPAARPLPDPLRGSGRGVRTVLPFPQARASQPTRPPALPPAAAPPPAGRTAPGTLYVEPPERRERTDRRRADRRAIDRGSPYGTERRSGRDDRQGDRRGALEPTAGIGLTRDYFSQVAERVTTTETGLAAGELIRFHD
jgi:hypothetical protein